MTSTKRTTPIWERTLTAPSLNLRADATAPQWHPKYHVTDELTGRYFGTVENNRRAPLGPDGINPWRVVTPDGAELGRARHRDQAIDMVAAQDIPRPTVRAVVACGKLKAPGRTNFAGELYIGGYHQAMLRAALRTFPVGDVVILSARYGLVPLTRRVAPYDVTFGDPEAVTLETLKLQAAHFEWPMVVMVFGGSRYADMVDALDAAPTTVQLFTGGMGEQKRAANEWAAGLRHGVAA